MAATHLNLIFLGIHQENIPTLVVEGSAQNHH